MPLSDAELAISAAVAGAEIVRDLHGKELSRVEKGHNDFATQADLSSEEAILRIIQQERPGDRFVGEESGTHAAIEGSAIGRVWLVDPLCGTLNYAAGTRDVAVNVALHTENNKELAAAAADPFTGEVFWTDGHQAFLRRNQVDKLLFSPRPPKTPLVEIDFHASRGKGLQIATAPAFRKQFELRVLSSTLPVPWVAVGRRAAFITDEDIVETIVHYAAGIAVCRAAGCVVTDLEGQPLWQGGRGLLIAADEETHKTLLGIIQSL